MKQLLNNRINELAICLITFLISICCFRFVTDDYSYFMSSLAAKQFGDFAYFDVHWQGFIGVREIYKLLYYLMPRINWHFVFSLIYEALSLYMLLRMLRLVILRNTAPRFILAIQVLFAILFIENIAFVSHTRVSLIICGTALINLAFTKDLSRRAFILNALVFIFSMLLRSESSIGTLVLVGAGYLIYYMDPIGAIKRLWLPILSIGVFLLIFTIDLAHTDIFVRQIEPEIEYKMMARRTVPLSEMKTAKDSVKYEAGTTGLWFDMKEMSPTYLRSIILAGSDLSYEHARDVCTHVFSLYSYYPFITWTTLVLSLFCLFLLYGQWLRLLKILTFILATFAVIYALDYNGYLVCNRHFLNLEIISLLVIGFYLFDTPGMRELHVRKGLIVTALLILFISDIRTVIKYKEKDSEIAGQVDEMEKTMKEFERRYTGRIVAVTTTSRFLMDRPFTLINEVYSGNTYIMFDWFTFHMTPRYMQYLSRRCQCDSNDPVAFFQWMADNHGLYIATPERYDLTERYMQTVHGCKLRFINPVQINSLTGIKNPNTSESEVRMVSIEK